MQDTENNISNTQETKWINASVMTLRTQDQLYTMFENRMQFHWGGTSVHIITDDSQLVRLNSQMDPPLLKKKQEKNKPPHKL